MDRGLNKTILLAEDNPQDVLLTRRALRKAGVQADLQVVTNGEEALKRMRECQESPEECCPRLLLLDLRLPRFSGHEILGWLQQNSTQSVPAVVLSTSSEPSDIERAMRLGASRYLCKPLAAGDLVKLLQELHLDDLLP
jgi:CheY-like chemotaxis protein